MSNVLGINAFHAGAAAALVIDGRLKFAIAEERLNRVKYYARFPRLAIKACLDHAGLRPDQIDHVALGRDSSANLNHKLIYLLKHPLLIPNLLKIRSSRQELDDLHGLLHRECGFSTDLAFTQHNIEHHLAHTASAYFISGWEEAAGITIDGSGDFVTCLFSHCRNRAIEPIHRIYVPNSLGSLYTMICQFIGFTRYGDEGKVMGLAPFGRDRYSEEFGQMIRFREDSIKLNPQYFLPFGKNQGLEINERGEMVLARHYSDYMIERFGEPRTPGQPLTERDRDLAFGLQKKFEEVYFCLLNELHRRVPSPRVALAGGCTLNSVANGKIFAQTPFEETCIQPAAGDEGLAIGAALYVSHVKLGEGHLERILHSYWGREYTEEHVDRSLAERSLCGRPLERPQLIRETVDALVSGAVVGWFQGRSEWGPRALGNRSILCHPGLPGMKDILNTRVKNREEFRPFAPAVLEDRLYDIYECCHPSPFMLHVYKTKPGWRERLPAVNHVDDSGRVQTVIHCQNPLFYDLIRAFEERTGIPLLLNTSFNENEPIVETPEEAIDCFLRSRMDVLVVESRICRKQGETPEDISPIQGERNEQ